MSTLYVEGMQGLGDNIYQHPVIKALSERHSVVLKTPWPQIYQGLKVSFSPSLTKLRTQAKNEKAAAPLYSPQQQIPGRRIRLTYTRGQRRSIPLFESLVECAPDVRMNYFLSLTEMMVDQKPLISGDYVIIRPPTLRKEWWAPSRNPRMQYIQEVIDFCNLQGLRTVVVCDINEPNEVYDGPRPKNATIYFERGELSLIDVLSLIKGAKLVAGGVGFIVPACIALGAPSLIVHGGAGGWNAPELIDCPGRGKLTHVLPVHYCRCTSHHHACSKEIDVEEMLRKLEKLI